MGENMGLIYVLIASTIVVAAGMVLIKVLDVGVNTFFGGLS